VKLCDEDRAMLGILCFVLMLAIVHAPLVAWWWLR